MQRARSSRRRWLALSCVITCAPAAAQSAGDAALLECRDAAAASVTTDARAALARIDGLPRQLLALSGYLRSGALATRWSWDAARILAYPATAEGQAALAEIGKVQAAFSARNPGYALRVNTQVRSLDVQLQHWNDNASVVAAASALDAPARAVCAASPKAFQAWLRAWRPPVPANLAVPGLSPHGQGRAYDFQVIGADGALVAGTDSRRIDADWIDGGWAGKLAEAIAATSTKLKGPLASPREPWHYAYQP